MYYTLFRQSQNSVFMYIRKIQLKNIGPINDINIQTKFSKETNNPTPLIIVGENGAGKSILLSHVADFILELQNEIFPNGNILKEIKLGGHNFFKIVGGLNTTIGHQESFAYLALKNNQNQNKSYEYLESSGIKNENFFTENHLIDCTLTQTFQKSLKQISKLTTQDKETLEQEFKSNAYCYFMPNRFEKPHWLNSNSFDSKKIYISDKQIYKGMLGKTFIIESCSDEINSWILDVFLDSSVRVEWTNIGLNTVEDPRDAILLQNRVKLIQKLLSIILKIDVNLTLNYRNNNSRISITTRTKDNNNKIYLPSLSNLSTGQSILLNLFCSIIKSGEFVNLTSTNEDIKGIVVIDEIELHLHSDLQFEILPKLIQLFPQIQFIISTHSPIFLFGMEEKFGKNNIQIIEMPNGNEIKAEKFREFEKVYDCLRKTEKFKDEVKSAEEKIKQTTKNNIIVCEGKTDSIHLEKAFKELELDCNSIEFISPDEEKGLGANALEKLLENISKIPNSGRKIIGIFDRDIKETLDKHWNFNNEVKEYGNNVFSFCIPAISFLDENKKEIETDLEIEHYYPINIIKTMVNNRRLYLGSEFKGTGIHKSLTVLNSNLQKHKNIIKGNHIIDQNVNNIKDAEDDLEGNKLPNLALSKNEFAEAIKNGDIPTKVADFENFRLIHDKIKKIIGEQKKQ